MPDKMSDEERKLVDQFLAKAAAEGKSLVQPLGKCGIDYSVASNQLTSPGLQKRIQRGKFLRARIQAYYGQGLSTKEVAEKMQMSISNVLYHARKLKLPTE